MSIQTKEYHAQWRKDHAERWNAYSRQYYDRAREKIRRKRQSPASRKHLSDYLKRWRAANSDKRKADAKAWAEKNKQRIALYRKNYAERRRMLYSNRKEEICARKRQLSPKYRNRVRAYSRVRRKTDIQFALADRLRATMSRALRRQFTRKSARTFDLIGCSPAELRALIESLFLPGMSWTNRALWHVDHKRPLAAFDLTDPSQQRLAFHFSNLQPLWAHDNLSKSDRI